MDNHSKEENPDWDRIWGYNLIQIILMSSVNEWKIGMIINGERNKRKFGLVRRIIRSKSFV